MPRSNRIPLTGFTKMKTIILFLLLTITLSIGTQKIKSQNTQSSIYQETMRRLVRVERRIYEQGWFKKDAYRIYIVNDQEPNAIAYPNAVILINSGLMSAIKSDEELELILWLLITESSC